MMIVSLSAGQAGVGWPPETLSGLDLVTITDICMLAVILAGDLQ
jgi:hypothetical protein